MEKKICIIINCIWKACYEQNYLEVLMYTTILENIDFTLGKYPEDIWHRYRLFLEKWHDIQLYTFPNVDIAKQLDLPRFPDHLNSAISFLLSLCCHTKEGRKGKRYSAFEYMFRLQNICIGFDEELEAITLLREGGQDFYYAVRLDDFGYNDPPVTRFYRHGKKESFDSGSNETLLELFAFHLFGNAGKPWVKGIGNSYANTEVQNLIAQLEPLFKYKITAKNYTLWEGNNGLMAVYPLANRTTESLLKIFRWDNKDKVFSDAVNAITNCGWSDNLQRYRL